MSIAGTENFDDEHHEQHSVAGGGARLVVTQEGTLDPSLLIRTEGYMYKKGGAVNARGGFRNWKKRFFVLAPVDFFGYQGYELQYYDAPNGTLKGTIALNDVDVYVDSKSANKKVKFEFQLILQNGGELQLSCDTEEEREEWVKTLQVIVDFLHKVATQPAMMLDGYDPMMEDDAEVFQIGDELAQNCQAFGPGLFGSEAGKSTQFVINLHDIAGQRVTKGGMPIVATISNEDSLYYLAVLDNDDGSYYCNYVLGTAGKYQLSITLNEEHHIFGSPFDIEILPSKTVPKFCVAEGDILQQMATKSTGTFMIYAMDGFGNRKTRGGDPFEVSIMGPGQVIDLEDRNDGSYACTITTTNVQQQSQNMFTSPSIMIMVTLYGKSIENSPFKPVMVDGTRPQSFLSQAAANSNMNGAAAVDATTAAVNRPASRTAAAAGGGSGKEKVSTSTKPGGNDAVSETASQRAPSIKQTAGSGAGAGTNGLTQAPLTPRQQPSSEKPQTTPQPSVAAASSTPATVTSLATHSSLRTPPPPPGGVNAHDNFQTPSTLRMALAASSSQHQQQQPTAATPTTEANLAGLSRLERSRQRALLAKSIADQNTHGTGAIANNATNATNAALSPTSAKKVLLPPPAASSSTVPFSSSINAAANDAASPATSVKPFSSSAASTVIAGGRLAQLAARSKMTLEALKAGNAPPSAAASSTAVAGAAEGATAARGGPPPSSSSSASHQQHHQLQQELLRHLHAGLGSATAPPSTATTAIEQRLWQRVHAMLTNDAHATSQLIRQHLLPHTDVLWQLFTLFGDRAAAVMEDGDDSLVLRLASAQGYGGLMKLLEVYEVLPHFLTRLEVKMIFNLCLTSQKLVRAVTPGGIGVGMGGGGSGGNSLAGLEFASFVKLLLFVAEVALNKAAAFAEQYASPESRVDFVLVKLGLGDPTRFQHVRRALLQTHAADI